MPLTFEWDDRKAKANLAKHNLGFEEAATVFGDPLSLTIPTRHIPPLRIGSSFLACRTASDCWL